jgi:hypothetical protein
MERFGFCYVADCEAYIDEAMRSIASLRVHMPDVPVALVTHSHLFRKDACVTDWVQLQQTRSGPILKADSWHAPYERVIFLDTDTLIIGDLTDVFPLLDRFDLASTPEPNAITRHGIDSGVPRSFPELNNGFLAFRKTESVRTFFDTWLEEYDRLHDLRGVTANQPAFRIALWKYNSIRHLTLGSEYNLLPHTNSSVSQTVAVLHDRSPERFRLAATINRHIEPRAIVPGFGPVFGFATRRGWARQFARLTWSFLCVLLRPSLVQQKGHPVIWWHDGID